MIPTPDFRVVLDTNVLLVSVSSHSAYHWIFQKLIQGQYQLCVSNEILWEYEEILSRMWNAEVAKNVVRTLLLLPNVSLVQIYYHWQLIQNDLDDNKFVDCAAAANAHVLVTHDHDFDILKTIEFPKLHLATVAEFRQLLLSHTK